MANKLFWAVGAAALLACACTTEVVDHPTDPGTGGSGNSGVGAGGTGGSGAGGAGAAGGGGFAPLQPHEGTAQNITLSVFSDGWGVLLDEFVIDSEGPVSIDVAEENPYTEPPQYYVYAKADGFYTELYSCIKGETIHVDLDAVPDRPNAIAGVIFATQGYFADQYLDSASITLVGPTVTIPLVTDSQGRYGVEGLPAGTYRLNFFHQQEGISLETDNVSEGTDYEDLYFAEAAQAS